MRNLSMMCCVAGLFVLLGLSGSTSLKAEEPKKEEPKDELVANPIYKHWAAFKVGATVTRREKVKFPADSEEGRIHPDQTLVKDITYTLKDLTPEKAVVEVVETEHGRGSLQENAPFKITYLANFKKGLGTPKGDFTKHKEEDVEVEVHKKTYKGKLIETTHKIGDILYTQKIWISDDIPGGIIKDEKTQKQGDTVLSSSTLEILNFKLASDSKP
jgi:hypothetical protein